MRRRIFREVLEQFWQIAQAMPERNRHTLNAAWRLLVGRLASPPAMDLRSGQPPTKCVSQFQRLFLSELVLHHRTLRGRIEDRRYQRDIPGREQKPSLAPSS